MVGEPFSFIEIARYDWCSLNDEGDELLHALAAPDDPEQIEQEWGGPGTTACGIHDEWVSIAGLGSRMGAYRCGACCFQTGIPTGKGSPKNDKALRPLVGLDG